MSDYHRSGELTSIANDNIRRETDDVLSESILADHPDISPYTRSLLEDRWVNAGIENDLIFAYVMRNPDLFLQLMQRILPKKQLSHVTRHEQQKTEFASPGAKSVRYDVYSEIDGFQFVVEMQMRNAPDLVRRTRYYQSLLDIQNLNPGASYRELPDSFVIMICSFDLFGHGRHVYQFRNIDIIDHSLEMGDGTDKIFINTRGTLNDISKELQNFLDFINGGQPADDYCQQVAECVDAAKHDVEVRRMFIDVNIKQMAEMSLARKEAREEGRAEGALSTLCNLASSGKISLSDAVKDATAYGITNETDFRCYAQKLGITL